MQFVDLSANRSKACFRFCAVSAGIMLGLCAAWHPSGAQTPEEALRNIWEKSPPFITYYTTEHYKAELQNWCIEQGDDGIMYFANNSGVLQFDGSAWRVIRTEKGNPVRSLAKDSNGRIYVGGIGEVGYLEPDLKNGMRFHSIISSLDSAYHDFGDLWSTYCINDTTYFVGEHHVLIWRNNTFQVVTDEGHSLFGFSWMINGHVYINSGNHGLSRLEGYSLRQMPAGADFSQRAIFGVMPFGEKLLAVDASKQLLVYDYRSLQPFVNGRGERTVFKSKVYHGIELSNGDYAMGTTGSGLYLVDRSGAIRLNVSKQTGLSSDAIYYVFQDREGDVWLATDNGVSRVEINSPLRVLNEKNGADEGSFDIEFFNNTLYRATGKGLFKLEQRTSADGESEMFFTRVAPIDQLAQDCHVVGDRLISSSQTGIFTIDKQNKLSKIYPWYSTVLEVPSRPGQNRLLFETARSGIGELEYANGHWVAGNERLEISGSAHDMIRAANGNVFINTRRNGIFEVVWSGSQTLKGGYELVHHDTTHGLASMNVKAIERVGNQVYASTINGFYRFDSVGRTFKDVDLVTRYLAGYKGSWIDEIVSAEGKSFWLVIDDHFTSRILKAEGDSLRSLPVFGRFSKELITKLYDSRNGMVIIGSNRSMILFNERWHGKAVTDFKTLIRRVTLGKDSLINPMRASVSVPSIAYDNNDIKFDVALPSYDLPTGTQYQFMLEGFDNAWSAWATQTQIGFTNLSEGKYTFRVRAKNVYGYLADEDRFVFSILPPWYRTWWAYCCYLAGLTALIVSIVYWRSKELVRETLRLERIVRERTEKISQQAEKLKEMDHVKSSFFANISHEFRTPLTLILAPLENEIRKRPEENKEGLQLIRRSAYRLLELVNQLLDLSKMESGKMELHIRRGDMRQFLLVIASSFDSLAGQKQITFQKRIDIPANTFWYDQDKVEKIITNLLANAFKFTPLQGTVSLAIGLTETRMLSIVIADTGPGIPEDEQASIFSPFYQARQTVASHLPGTGLGLSLVKELVKLYRGTISLKSKPGLGTTFTVTIPVLKEAFNDENILDENAASLISQSPDLTAQMHHTTLRFNEQPASQASDQDTIVIAEDNSDMREFMTAALQASGYTVMAADNGEDAARLVLSHIPNLVLSDLMMPRVNGIQLTQQIKEDERTSHIPVILLTAKNESETRLEGLKTGADDYLTKPFSQEELLVRIQNLIAQRKKLAVKFRERIVVSPSSSASLSLDEKFILKAQHVVEANISDYTFGVEAMADEMNLSRTQLLRKVKALTGLSPSDFIRDVRLKRAAEMITQKVDTITQIGYAVGFNDQSYFAKCFKKRFGVSPSEYAQQ